VLGGIDEDEGARTRIGGVEQNDRAFGGLPAELTDVGRAQEIRESGGGANPLE